jgi:hypothetical protein
MERHRQEREEQKRLIEEAKRIRIRPGDVLGEPDGTNSRPWRDQSSQLAAIREEKLRRPARQEFVDALKEQLPVSLHEFAPLYAYLLGAVEDRPPPPNRPLAPPPGFGVLLTGNISPYPVLGLEAPDPKTFRLSLPYQELSNSQRLEAARRLERFYILAERVDFLRWPLGPLNTSLAHLRTGAL